MSARHMFQSSAVRASGFAFVIAAGILICASFAAFEVDSSTPGLSARGPLTTVVVTRADTTSDDLVGDAIDNDPFSPQRRPGSSRYGTRAAAIVLNPAPAVPAGQLRLVGTVLDAGGGDFALCQLGSDAPRVVRVGQSIGNYVLRRISQGAASFDSPAGDRVELRVSKPGS